MALTSASVRVLVAGDVGGKFETLNDRVKQVVAKSGNFHMLLCVGPFLESESSHESLAKFLESGQKAVIPTYFLGLKGESASAVSSLLDGHPDANLKYLGMHGVTKLEDLNIAYFDDLAVESLSTSPASELQTMCERATTLEGEVDLLLTCRWPDQILPPNSDPNLLASVAGRLSPACRKLACAFRPRYHVASCENKFFTRLPYANPDLGAGSHVTRFIGLGGVGNPIGARYLHALGLVPSGAMSRQAFLKQPPNTTPFPYSEDKNPRNAHSGTKRGSTEEDNQSWRWGDQNGKRTKHHQPSRFDKSAIVVNSRKSAFVRNLPYKATEEDIITFFAPTAGTIVDIRRGRDDRGNMKGYAQVQFKTVEEMRKSCDLNENKLMGRPIFIEPATAKHKTKEHKDRHPVADCWFCLSNPTADLHLVVSVGSESYCALDKGPITPFHCLVVPIDHSASTLELEETTMSEISKYFQALSKCAKTQGLEIVIFERYLRLKGREGGNHCHYNVIGVPSESVEAFARGVSTVLDKTVGASFGGSEFQVELEDVVGDMEYMLAMVPGGRVMCHPIMRGERVPYNFLRDEVAAALGAPDKGDWKQCKLGTKDEEESAVAKFKAIFADHDIM